MAAEGGYSDLESEGDNEEWQLKLSDQQRHKYTLELDPGKTMGVLNLT